MDIQRIVMLKSVALLAAVAITLLLVHSLEAAPVALQHKHQDVSKRSLVLPDYLLRILGILPPLPTEPEPTTDPSPVTEEEQEMSSGDDIITLSLQPVHFNAALVGDIYLNASRLLLSTLKYNFVRIASLENVAPNPSKWQPRNDSKLVELHNGIFSAPASGLYRIEMLVNVEVDAVVKDSVNEMGIALCLDSTCNGQLHNTLNHRTFVAVLGKHTIELSGNFTLEENDAVKFFVYKTPFTGMMLLRETFISGATILS